MGEILLEAHKKQLNVTRFVGHLYTGSSGKVGSGQGKRTIPPGDRFCARYVDNDTPVFLAHTKVEVRCAMFLLWGSSFEELWAMSETFVLPASKSPPKKNGF